MAVEEIIDGAVAGWMADRLLIGALEVVDVQHLAGPRGLGEARQQRRFRRDRHVLALASAARLRFERFDPALVVGHVGAIDRAQRNPIAAAIAGCVMLPSRNKTMRMRWRCRSGMFQCSAVFN